MENERDGAGESPGPEREGPKGGGSRCSSGLHIHIPYIYTRLTVRERAAGRAGCACVRAAVVRGPDSALLEE